jgi:hypothetical protein
MSRQPLIYMIISSFTDVLLTYFVSVSTTISLWVVSGFWLLGTFTDFLTHFPRTRSLAEELSQREKYVIGVSKSRNSLNQ